MYTVQTDAGATIKNLFLDSSYGFIPVDLTCSTIWMATARFGPVAKPRALRKEFQYRWNIIIFTLLSHDNLPVETPNPQFFTIQRFGVWVFGLIIPSCFA
jgi:hypothetical protein